MAGKGKETQKEINIDISKVKWSHPMSLKNLSQIFDIHRNTMSKWLKNQTICNRQLSARRWAVAMYELPYEFSMDNLEEDTVTIK